MSLRDIIDNPTKNVDIDDVDYNSPHNPSFIQPLRVDNLRTYLHLEKKYKTHPKKMIKKNGNPRNFIFMIKANPTLISFTTFSTK